MKYKILLGILVLALIISLSFNVYYIMIQQQNETVINDMRSQVVLAWAREMSIAGSLIDNATTNLDMGRAHKLIMGAEDTAHIFNKIYSANPNSSKYLYFQMSVTPTLMDYDLFPYIIGYPTDLKYINPEVFEMFDNLTETIYNMTGLIWRGIDTDSGVDPTEQLMKEGVLADIINYCLNIQDLCIQIDDFSPKFVYIW